MSPSNSPPGAKASDNVELTDANMTISNDWPEAITVTVEKNHHMKHEFPSPVNLDSGASMAHHVEANEVPVQSSFDVTFHNGDTMKVKIGTGIFVTEATPPYFDDGTVGAVLAPGKPLSTGVDYKFLFFDGPGVLPPLINSAIQANLSAIIASINANGITVDIVDGISITLSQLQLDPVSVLCTYAGTLPSAQPNMWTANVVLRVGNASFVGSSTIFGQIGNIKLDITNLNLYTQVLFDSTNSAKPKVTALQCSLDKFTLKGTILDVLVATFPAIALLIAAGLTPYRVAGFINNDINQNIIDAINSAIGNASSAFASFFDNMSAFSSASSQSRLSPRASPKHPSHPRVTGDLSTWMSAPEIQAKTLGQIKLPGTHDSATYGLSSTLSQISYPDIQILWNLSPQTAPVDGTWPVTFPPTATSPLYLGPALYAFVMNMVNSTACTQDLSILQQLQFGIRSLDLRVYYDTRDGNFYTQHALRGPLFSDVLSQMQAFAQANPTAGELIFATISHTNLGDFPEQIPVLTKLINSYIPPENLLYLPGQWDFDTLAPRSLSSLTAGSPKVCFINGDLPNLIYPDTINNTQGYPGPPFDGEKTTLKDLEGQQGHGIECHNQELWAVNWTLGADNQALVGGVLQALTGEQVWVLQGVAEVANSGLESFLSQYGGAGGRFNLVDVDWLEYSEGEGSQVVPLVVGMNYSTE